ncbi:MAG: cell division protein ZapA [Pelosinus sp.]|nr:cell division protein ZapA [Pelosinus sp.]
MSEKKSKVTVEIFGEKYALKGDADAERILRVAELIDHRMKMVARGNPGLSPAKVSVLAALNLADEYLRLEQDYQQLMEMLKD